MRETAIGQSSTRFDVKSPETMIKMTLTATEYSAQQNV